MRLKRFAAFLIFLTMSVTLPLADMAGSSGLVIAAQTQSISFEFEDGKTSAWIPKGNAVLSPSADIVHRGSYSLKVSGRTQPWEGPEADFTGKLIKGGKYLVSAWVYQKSKETKEVRLTAYSRDNSSKNPYDPKFYTTVAGNTAVPAGTWTELKGEYVYDYSGSPLQLAFYMEAPDTSYDFHVDDITIMGVFAARTGRHSSDNSAVGTIEGSSYIEADIPGLAEVYRDYFPIGVAIPGTSLGNSQQSALITKHFNSITAENDMKPVYMQPSEGSFDFKASDRFVQYCEANNLRLRGHTLIWHNAVPDWFFKDNEGKDVSRDVLLSRMKKHIGTIIKRYGDRVDSWDVVNEAVGDWYPYGLRDSQWRRIIGDDYVEKAFGYAREVVYREGLKVKLFYNDYNNREDPEKTEAIYSLLKGLKEKGLVDGVGYQCHLGLNYGQVGSIENSIRKFMDLGLKVEITELDISIYDNDSDSYTLIPDELLVKQGYKYAALMEMLKKYKGSITGVTLWGLKDDMSWFNYYPITRLDAPLIFDKNCSSKPAFWGMADPSRLKGLNEGSVYLKETSGQ